MHLLILGGGSAAFSAAHPALAAGWRVTVINEGLPIGGSCLHVGCVPSKFFIRAGEQRHHATHARFQGLKGGGAEVNFPALVDEQQELIRTLRELNYEEPVPQLEGLTVIKGRGTFIGPKRIRVGDQELEGDRVLIATGSRSAFPSLPGLEPDACLTNENLFDQRILPESLIVLGGGYIALELAQALARLGSKVTVLQRSAHLLSGQADYLGKGLADALWAEGVEVHCSCDIQQVKHHPDGVGVEVELAGQTRHFEADKVFVGLGREGQTDGLGLEHTAVETHGRGFIQTDLFLQTTEPGVYAAGDVLGGKMFVYTASYEAECAVHHMLGKTPARPVDYEHLPWVVFTDPQVAGVGLDELQAQAAGYDDVDTAELPVARWPRFRVAREDRGFIRLIRDRSTDRLLGARILAPEGGDLVTELALIIRHPIPLREIAEAFYPYLTLSEGIQRAVMNFQR